MAGHVLQFYNTETSQYEDFQTYRTKKARKEAKILLEKFTLDKYKFKED